MEKIPVQASLESPDGDPILVIEDMIKALKGSAYELDVEETKLNLVPIILMTEEQYGEVQDSTTHLPSKARLTVETP